MALRRGSPSEKGDEAYAFYGRPYGKSLCHAWGAGPVVLLPQRTHEVTRGTKSDFLLTTRRAFSAFGIAVGIPSG